MVSWIVKRVALASALLLITGCRMGVPIHVWQPPMLKSTVGKTVVLQAVAGDEQTAKAIKEKLLATVPSDPGRETIIIQPDDLQRDSMVQLASSSDDGTSDVALASVAKRQNVDFILRGQVLTHPQTDDSSVDRSDAPADWNQTTEDHRIVTENPQLTMSWRLTSVSNQPSNHGQPVVVDVKSAVDRYPDLALLADQNEILSSAAARETFRLITPSVDRTRVQLAIPYMIPGSSQVRHGNLAALAGRWAEAKQIWSSVLDRYPMQAAAAHNLALAAVASQDFSSAKALARQAIRLQPTPLHQRTLVWIELQQRAYHHSFNLPDPPEGWFVTHQ